MLGWEPSPVPVHQKHVLRVHEQERGHPLPWPLALPGRPRPDLAWFAGGRGRQRARQGWEARASESAQASGSGTPNACSPCPGQVHMCCASRGACSHHPSHRTDPGPAAHMDWEPDSHFLQLDVTVHYLSPLHPRGSSVLSTIIRVRGHPESPLTPSSWALGCRRGATPAEVQNPKQRLRGAGKGSGLQRVLE